MTLPTNSDTLELENVIEELYRAGMHRMYATEPHHGKSISKGLTALTARVSRP